MLGIGFLYFGAMLTIWLGLYAVVRYAFPDSLPGRVATVIT